MQRRIPLNHGIKRNKIDKMAFLTLFECVLSVSLQYKSKRVHVPKCTHFPTTGYARVLLFIFIRRELAEERYRMFISVYILWRWTPNGDPRDGFLYI